MASWRVVVDKPWAECVRASGVAGEDLAVGALTGEPAVVALDYARSARGSAGG